MVQPKNTEPHVQHVQSVYKPDNIDRSQLRMTESCKDVVQSEDEAETIDSSQLRMTESCNDLVKSVDEADIMDSSQLRKTEYRKDVVQSVDEADTIDSSQFRMTEYCEDVVQSVDEADTIDSSQFRMTESCEDVVKSVDEADTIDSSLLRMTESCENVNQSVDEADSMDKCQLRMTESYKKVVQLVDKADTIDVSQLIITELVEDTVTSEDAANKNSQKDVQSSSNTEFERRSTHISSIESRPKPTEEDNLLQAAFTVLYTVPRAIEHFIDRIYKGGCVQAIHDHKVKLKAKLRSKEWDLLSKLRVHHRLYNFYDQIIQDTILDNEVLDLLITRCILRKEDRAEIEHHPRQTNRNKCILDLLIQRPEDSYSVLLDVLKESPTCSTELIDSMENQQFSHLKVVPQSRVKPCITGFHSVRLQKNYHNLIQNLSNTESIIDSLISNGVLEPDDRAEINTSGVQAKINRKLINHIRSKEDYQFFLEALKEDPMNAKLVSDLESCDVTQDDLTLLQAGTTVPQLTNRPGFQTLVTVLSIVKDVHVSDTEPEIDDTNLPADLYRLQSWYKKIITMTSMDSHQYQQFVKTVNEVLGRISEQNHPVVKETTLNTEMQKEIQKMIDGFKEKEENSELKEKLKKMETELCEIIPKNIRELIRKQIEDWEEKDKMFVSTRATDYVMERLQDNSCLTLTAPSGVGKSFIARHAALLLKKQGYSIIPLYSPTDIRTYYQPGKHTVFIVDDICGNFTASQQQIDYWKQLLPVINTIIADKNCKIIVSCRLQVYKDDKFNILLPFKSCECNLISDKLCLTSVEKSNIAIAYIGKSMTDIDILSSKCDFFPLLCSLYNEREGVDVKEYFKNPFDVYKSELDRLSEHGDEGNYKICSLALCVLFDNQLNEKWFQGKATEEQRQIIYDTCEACEFNSIPKAKLKKALDTLDGTFICKQNGIYRTIHDKLFDFLTHYFGQKMIECLIDHGDSGLVHERFIWQTIQDDRNSDIDYIIEIPDDYLESYLERFIKDWSEGNVTDVFNNNNMKASSFREELLQHLLQLDKSQQVALASTKDTVVPKESSASGNTPLVLTCYDGYTDMVQWMLHNDVDVDQCRDDGVTGLIMASTAGHSDIVKLLLERNPNVDLCENNGCSPLLLSSQIGHTDIVKLLLEKDANVDLCTNDGWSPLNTASNEGHIEIVKLLLEKDANVDLSNKGGWSPLKTASDKGHTEIVKLLLEKDANVDLCNKDGWSPLKTASNKGHTEIIKLLLEKDANVDLCNKGGSSPLKTASNKGHTEIIKLLLEKDANVDLCNNEGWSPLNTATSNEGHTDIVKLLLEKDANVDLCNKDGWSPLKTASNKGHTEIVKLLLEKDANVDLCNNEGWSPLNTASNEGNTEIVKLLLKKDANVDLCNKGGWSPLNTASNKGHTDIVKLLLEKDANVNLYNNNGWSSLNTASNKGHTEIVKLLLEKDANVDLCNKSGFTPLITACTSNNISIAQLLIKHKPNVDAQTFDGGSALYFSVNGGNLEITQLLLENNADCNICGPSKQSIINTIKNYPTKTLDKYKQDCFDSLIKNALQHVADYISKKSVDYVFDVEAGSSPLHIACFMGRIDIVRCLLDHNANINITNEDGTTPLYFACELGHEDIVRLLLDKGADTQLCRLDGKSPLQISIDNGHTSIVIRIIVTDYMRK
ncbi:Hypothetical predicted protein [Mytilus galloprovincialis]|nr:Hypothetical predicted protein [Mytilus galloprovincialis]